MKNRIIFTFLLITLAACTPVAGPAETPTQPNATDIQNTAVAIAQTGVALTQSALPTATPLPPTVTPTATMVYPTPSPFPTQPPLPIFTPDPIQVERWREYQTELAKALFVYNPSFPDWKYGPEISKDALCEWDILGRSGQEVYTWAACLSGDGFSFRDNPTVIYPKSDGSIQEVDVASGEVNPPGGPYLTYDLHLFPIDIQEKLCLYYFYKELPQCHDITSAYNPATRNYSQSRQNVLMSHLEYRESHPEEPPLVVLSATPMATSTP